MKIVRANGEGVAERWRSQYYRNDQWSKVAAGSSEDIYNKLCALGLNPSAVAAAKAIGNKSWTHLYCAGCHDDVTVAINLGRDSEDRDLYFCKKCVRAAARLLKLCAEDL